MLLPCGRTAAACLPHADKPLVNQPTAPLPIHHLTPKAEFSFYGITLKELLAAGKEIHWVGVRRCVGAACSTRACNHHRRHRCCAAS